LNIGTPASQNLCMCVKFLILMAFNFFNHD